MNFLMMAAHDTLASSLTSFVYFLSVNPDWQEKLREEVRALGLAGGEPLPYERLDDVRGCHRMSVGGRGAAADAGRRRARAINGHPGRVPDRLAGRAAARHDPQTPEEPPLDIQRHTVLRDWIALVLILVVVPLSVFGGTNIGCIGQGVSQTCAPQAVFISPLLLMIAGVIAGLITSGWTGLLVVGFGQIAGQVVILAMSYLGGRPVPIDPFNAIIATLWFGVPIAIGYGLARLGSRIVSVARGPKAAPGKPADAGPDPGADGPAWTGARHPRRRRTAWRRASAPRRPGEPPEPASHGADRRATGRRRRSRRAGRRPRMPESRRLSRSGAAAPRPACPRSARCPRSS